MYLRAALNSWFFCLSLSCPEPEGMCHHTQIHYSLYESAYSLSLSPACGMRLMILAFMVLRPPDWVPNTTFLGSSLQEAYHRFLSLRSHGPAPHSKCPMCLCGEPWLIWCIGSNRGMRSSVGDLPGYLLVVVWLPCLIAQLIMTIWSCVWAWIRPANLASPSLSAVCQVFSSQVMSCQSHDPQQCIAIHAARSL